MFTTVLVIDLELHRSVVHNFWQCLYPCSDLGSSLLCDYPYSYLGSCILCNYPYSDLGACVLCNYPYSDLCIFFFSIAATVTEITQGRNEERLHFLPIQNHAP